MRKKPKQNLYKKMLSFKCNRMISKYKSQLSNNEVIEVLKNGVIKKHIIIRIPGVEENG